jgi:hypothetical protein
MRVRSLTEDAFHICVEVDIDGTSSLTFLKHRNTQGYTAGMMWIRLYDGNFGSQTGLVDEDLDALIAALTKFKETK